MLDWFTTIPGILIICGVLLLVIAIILFIVGSKKDKKEAKQMANGNTTDGSSTVNNVNNTVTNVSENSISISPVEPVVDSTISTPTVDNTVSTPVASTVPTTPAPEVTPEVNTLEQTVIDIPAPEVIPAVNEMPVKDEAIQITEPVVDTKEEAPTVYGGTAPVYNFTAPTDKPVTIYGGNDPLEATQTLPKMEEHHLPYGGVDPETKIVGINQEQPVINIPTPVSQPVTEIPVTPVTSIPDNDLVTPDTARPVINIPSDEESKPVVEEL